MISTDSLDDKISEYYDEEMSEDDLFNYEARIAISKGIRDYTNEKCFEYFKISNSIKKVKLRASQRAQKMTEEIEKKLIGNTNSVFLERINKFLSNFFLNINRNNSK